MPCNVTQINTNSILLDSPCIQQDIDTTGRESVVSFKSVQEKITMIDGVISTRVIYDIPGKGYAKNLDGEYFV